MKKLFLLVVATLAVFSVNAQVKTWTNDPAHSRLAFSIRHLTISEIEGRFADFSATVTTSRADYMDAKISLTAKIASIDTDVEARDNHLRTADFFDAAKYPTMTFKSTSLKKINAKKGIVSGLLTFHGITKPVKLNVTFFGMLTNPMNKKTTAGFQVTGVVKRSDFQLGPNFPEAILSDNVRIVANVEFSPDK